MSNVPAGVEGVFGASCVEVVAGDGVAVLTLCGELDLEMSNSVRTQLRGLDADITLNCAELTFMDASGINLFFEIDQICVARGAKLTVVNAPDCVTKLLTVVQLDGVFDVRSLEAGA